MAIIRNFRLPVGIGLSADYIETFGVIQSLDPNTGAIVSRGGVGIGNSVSIAGRLQLFNGANYTAFVSSASGNTFYILPSSSPATGSSVLQSTSAGVMSWVPLTTSSGTSGLATTAENINTVAASTNATHFILFSPINGGSGVAVSSDTGLTFNPASNTISLSTLSATTVNTSTASVSGSTASTTTTTGALVVTGGVGIGQSVSVGGRLQLFNGANYTAFVSSASGNTVYTLPATSPATGSSVLQSDSAGVMSWVPMTATGGASGNTAQNIVVNSAGNASAFHPILFTPASLSAGSAVSSDGTISFNPSTEILNVSGLAITSTTASTSTSNGALQVAGGVGISGRLSFNQASFGTTGIATNPTMAMIGQTGDPIFMSVLEDNSISFEGTQGQLFSITPNLSTGYIYSVNDITGIPLIRANANANVTANEYAGNFGIGLTNPGYKLHVLGSVGFTSTTASTSTTTGTLVVGGGVGIGGSLYVASATAISGVTINNGIITGNLTGTATTSGFATTSNYSNQSGYGITAGLATTATYSHQAGYAITSGSASIATTATYSHQAGYAITSGSASIATTATYSHQAGYAITSGSSGTANTATYSHQSGYGLTSGFATTASYSHQAGYAITSGSSNTSGYATTAGLATTATNINVIAASTNASHPLLFTPTSGSASGIAVSSNGTLVYNPSTDRLSTSGLAVTATTASTNSTSGALVVTGGVGIGGSLYVAGDLTINGTTTTINTVTLTVDDKNIELGSVSVPSDVTAEGGGITLKGATDKSINWYTGTGWSSSESWNLVSGNTYKINNTTVLSNSSIGTGITNSSLTALGTISTGVWAGTLITALYGGTGFNSYTKGDLLVGAGTTLIKHAVGSQNQILIADLFSGSGLSWATFANPTYGSFYSTITQQVAGAGVSTPVNFNSTYESNRVSIFGGAGTSSRIQIQDAGPYSITFSAQINLVSGNTDQNGDFWFRVNGQDVPQSNSSMSIAGKDFETLITVNFVYTFANNDYFEIIMSSLDTHFSIEYQSGLTNPPRPNTPSIILSVLPITHIVGASGSGISGILSLNGSTSSQQYFLTGTSGTGFNVQTASGNHTFNIPIAGSGATGLVTGIAQTFEGSKTFSASTIVSSSTASTTTTTGALIVSGGVGIGQSVSVGGRLQLFNGANYTAFVSSASGNTVYTLPATSPATGSSVLQSTSAGVLSWVAMTAGAASGNTAQNIVVNTAGNANVFHPILFTPSSLSAGSAVSSDSTISFNPSTEILNVSGLAITSGTASTNTTTGALVVRGGLGVTGQLSFAQASFGFTGITTNPTMSFIGATSASPITLTVLTDNSLNFEGSQGSVFSIDSNLSSGEIFSVSDISGLPIISASAGQTVNINEFGGYTQIGNGSINSSSTTTGSLVVSGGLGLTGNANIGGTVRITSTTASTTSSSGALVVSGGVGIGLSASIGGRLLLFNGANYTALVSSATGNTVYTLPATSPATGTSILQSTAAGVMSWISTAGLGASSGGALDGSVQYKSGSGFGGTRSFFFNTTTNGLRLGNFPGEEIPTSTSAALLIEQTIGSFNGSVNGTLIAANAISGFTGDLINLQTNAITKFKVDANGAIGTSSSLTTGGDISITSTTQATNTITGALKVAGGVGIGQTLFVGGSISNANYFYSGGNNFTKSGQAQGDIFLDNNSNDTPGVLYYYKNNTNFGIDAYATGIGSTRLRIVRDLNESTGAEIWSIDRTGVVTRTAWDVGEVINTRVYNNSDLGMSATTTINSTTYTNVAAITYTPKSTTSHLWIEFDANYDFSNGTTADDFFSRITVAGSVISERNQIMVGQVGGGTRSGVIFPISGRYTNSSTSGIAITVQARWGTADDAIRVYGSSTSGYMRIQEIGR